MKRVQRIAGVLGLTVMCVTAAAWRAGAGPTRVGIPANATLLQGTPTVRVESTENNTTRHMLDAAQAAQEKLVIRVADGKFYWASLDNRALRVFESGAYTYLSADPGKYVRITRVDDRIEYVEHVDLTTKSVTWWGNLEIAVRK